MTEYTEPTNEQLAKFLSIYAEHIPAFQQFRLSHGPLNPAILEMLLEKRPELREGGLRHHRKFQEEINQYAQDLLNGELKCEYIRPNGKRCVNHNESGSIYCGLHKESE